MRKSFGCKKTANPAVDPALFSRWTLRDKAAQRRSPLRYPSSLAPTAGRPLER